MIRPRRLADAWEAFGIKKPRKQLSFRVGPMRTVIIERDPSEDSGTFGVLTAGMFRCYTLELPWKNNLHEVSCIMPPPGFTRKYQVVPHDSPKFGKCYQIKDVEGRDSILIHKGNFAGDREKGLKSDVEGCVLLGNAIGEIAGQRALLGSKDAYTRFLAEMEGDPFTLLIRWA